MRALSAITLLVALILPTVAFAEIQTLTATHTYILGDHDSKEDARQRCLLETKRKILEQAGVYIESASEMKNFDLTKDKITSFAAAVMQIKDTKEEVGFQQGHMTLTLTITAQVDRAEVRKQLAAPQEDAGMRDTVASQQERLKHLEAQLETMMQRQQGGKSSERAPASPPSDISATDLLALRTAAAQGNAQAQVWLGALYFLGHGVPQDYVKARQWFDQAAAQGNADAQRSLGLLYNSGWGVPQDYTKARQWYEKAAAQGDAGAQVWLGALYAQGHGVPQDYVQAASWYEKAAAQGDADAQYFLGKLYFYANGVPRDYAKAHQWYERAAAQGNAEAQLNLGMAYTMGAGVPEDEAQAAKWYEKAAAQGVAVAQDALGWQYANGKGVPQDDIRAYMWWSLATAKGNRFTAKQRDKVAMKMTPAQIAEAQRLTQQCQAQQLKGC